MTESEGQTKSPLERPASGQFQKGQSGNPKGKPKGALSKTTRFRQLLTTSMQNDAVLVVKKVIAQAKKGDKESQKLVVTMLQPFIKREAEKDGSGGGNKRPLVNIVVNKTDGRPAQPLKVARIIEHDSSD